MPHNTIGRSGWILAAFALLFLVARLFVIGGEGEALSGEMSAERSEKNPFEGIALSAEAAFVYDIAEEKTLFSKHAEAQMPLASLAKLMTVAVAAQSFIGDSEVRITKEAVSLEGDTGLLVGERWRMRDLAALTLLTSSNDGAAALAGAAEAGDGVSFVERMNRAAKALGLAQTYFINETGLDIGTRVAGAYGSAKDAASLLSFLLVKRPEMLLETPYAERLFVSLDDEKHEVLNTHETIETLPGVVASKTGFTDLAGGNLAVIFEAAPMHPIAVVVLGSTAEGRFTDVEKLVWATVATVENNRVRP